MKLALYFFLLTFPGLSYANVVEELTIGQILESSKDKAIAVIETAEDSGNNILANTGYTLKQLIRALEYAYEDKLDLTLESLDDSTAKIFQQLDESTDSAAEILIATQNMVDSAGAVISRLPGVDDTPAVTGVSFPLMAGNVVKVMLHGFNFDLWESYDLASDSLELELVGRTSTRLEIMTSVKNMHTDESVWWEMHKAKLTFKKDRILFPDRVVEFLFTGISTDWSLVQGRVNYFVSTQERVYQEKSVVRRKSQGRVGRSFSHQLNFTPKSPYLIDTDSVRYSWWEHDECDNGYTKYEVQALDEYGIRVHMRGREQGGFDRDCGASLAYSLKIFKLETKSHEVSSDWTNLTLGSALLMPDDGEFASVEIREPSGEAKLISAYSSPYPFLELIRDRVTNRLVISGI